jgi:intracellular sulfur oxidation DsrE/DsrF family protein
MNRILLTVLAVFSAVVFAGGGAGTEARAESNALAGVRVANVYFDVNIGEPDKLLKRLELIETTYGHLVAAGFSPQVVVGIRGKASNFFTRDSGYVLDADLPVKKQLAARVEQFRAMGFAIEQCRVAAGMQEIDVVDFLPQLQVVDNGYVSMIGYQAQGYAFVPMD